MFRKTSVWLALSALGFFVMTGPKAFAQGSATPAEEPAETPPPAETTTTTSGDTSLSDEQALLEEQAPVETGRTGLEPREEPNVDYFFVGLLARGLVVPAFIQNIFVVTDTTPVNGGFGLFFNYRKNAFNVQVEANYQGFGVDGTYRGVDQPETETEHIKSGLGLLYINVSFAWAFDITDWFAFELGFGIGVGGFIGDLYRQAAVPTAGGTWEDCAAPGIAAGGTPAGAYCDADEWPPGTERPGPNGDPYQITRGTPNPFYFGERGIPPVFFNIDLPRIAFRFKPIRQIQLRIEGAYNLYGFSFGASAAYGF